MKKILFLLNFFVFLIFPDNLYAQEIKTITIVNPVRVAPYTKNLQKNIQTQYQSIKSLDLQATWLLTYDVLLNEEAIKEIKSFDSSQELGVWLEVGENLAKSSEVNFNTNLAWHYPNKIFLSGYTQTERIKLVEELFNKFKQTFGYYPKSVGSWWTDSYSLNYMHKNYGVIANLGVADQFSTDNYQVWGQYWSKPFLISKNHSGIPAKDYESSSGVVNLQWASRDPQNGYFSSLYSFQDFFVLNPPKDWNYFEKLSNLYLEDEFSNLSNIVLGLESDLSDYNAYSETSGYYQYLLFAKNNRFNARILNMSEFSEIFKKEISNQIFATDTSDFENNIRNIWYQSPNLRVGLRIDNSKKEIQIYDLRFYEGDFYDPYYFSPNRELKLSINIPSVIDQFQDEKYWEIKFSNFEKVEKNNEDKAIEIYFDDKVLKLHKEGIFISDKIIIPYYVKNNNQVLIKDNFLTNNKLFVNNYLSKRYLTPEAKYFFNSKKNIFLILIALVIYCYYLTKLKKNYKILFLIVTSLILTTLYFQNTQQYYVSQSEVDTLNKLSSLEKGKVLTVKHECLQCDYHTPLKPAVMIGENSYVAQISKMPIFNSESLENISRDEILNFLKNNNIKYIYLVRYEGYKQNMPYQQGDINARLIYSNANTQLWQTQY